MGLGRLIVIVLVSCVVSSVWCHHHHHGLHGEKKNWKEHGVDRTRKYGSRDADENAVLSEEVVEKNRRSLNVGETKGIVPFSARRLEKMLEKAILKIITGDLSTADMLLLKSLNYSLEEVLAIRERELSRRKDEEVKKEENLKTWTKILYGEGVTDKKNRHWSRNSMETDYSSPPSPDLEDVKYDGKKDRSPEKVQSKDFDFDEYNRQAVIDYENLASKLEFQQSWSDPAALDYEESVNESKNKDCTENFHRSFDKAMEPHVVFKIRYDDSEFDSSSNSDETRGHAASKAAVRHHVPSTLRHTTSRNTGNSFHAPASSAATSSSAPSAPVHTPLPVVYQLGSNALKSNYVKNHVQPSTTRLPNTVVNDTSNATKVNTEDITTTESTIVREQNVPVRTTESTKDEVLSSKNEESETKRKKVSEYEGLEWVEDDVYRVIPAFADSLGYENNEENETSDYEEASNYQRPNWNGFPEGEENDTLEYQNEAPDTVKMFVANTNVTSNHSLPNLSSYQQLALAHRREGNVTSTFDSQGQKAIEDIKSRVLALTGRFNLSANTNQVLRERLTMFSPTCQVPRNTDPDAWADPFSMNMHFQLNLTSGDHVVAAKLRIFKLPQENLTSSVGTFEEEEEDEKKIRISIYYYTKSLKKHRSKKRLMDSVVTPLTSEGTHLALDVRQGLRFWRLNPRNPHGTGSNHGLVIQVEDQDGRPLKPALYIQQPSCGDHDSDQKAYQFVPALFIRACTRYVRIVNDEAVTYVNCRH